MMHKSANDPLIDYLSNRAVSAPQRANLDSDYASDTILEEKTSALGLTCTGDLDYAAAKSLSVLVPLVKEHHSPTGEQNDNKKGAAYPPPPPFEDAARKIYTKELISNNIASRSRIESLSNYRLSCFDEDLQTCRIKQKKIQKMRSKENPRDDLAEKPERNSSNDSTVSSTQTDSRPSPSVSFSSVTIQEYAIQPGDNPGGNKGCPLTIAWEPISAITLDFEVYESVRSDNRRRYTELSLVAAHREHILRQLGYSTAVINAGTKAANVARRRRYQTIARLKSSKSHEVLEDIRRKIHNVLTCGEKQRRERKLLVPYLKGDRGGSKLCTKDSHLANGNTESGASGTHRTVLINFF